MVATILELQYYGSLERSYIWVLYYMQADNEDSDETLPSLPSLQSLSELYEGAINKAPTRRRG